MAEANPRLEAPALACDCHIHIYDKTTPRAPTATAAPLTWADVPAYRAVQKRLGTERCIVVQPTAYGTDNRCTLAAIAELGIDRTRGVAVIDSTLPEPDLRRLHEGGVRGARFQMLPGGALPWEEMEPVARRIAGLGWHIQMQMDGRLLPEREALIGRLPCTVVIDHVGKFLEPVTVTHPGFQCLLRLLDRGNVWMKLAAPYEVSRSGPPLYADVGALAKHAANRFPERMVWASNWPHVSTPDAPPDDAMLLDVLLDWVPDVVRRNRILVDNPARLYGF